MWPSLNQLLCAALPKEDVMQRRVVLSLQQHARSAHQAPVQEKNKRNPASPFSVRGSHTVRSAFWISTTCLQARGPVLSTDSFYKQDCSRTALSPLLPAILTVRSRPSFTLQS